MRIVLTAVLALGFLAAPVASFQVLGTSSAKAWTKCDAPYTRDEAKVQRTCT